MRFTRILRIVGVDQIKLRKVKYKSKEHVQI